MKGDNKGFLLLYLRSHRLTFCFCAVFIAVFSVIFYLYGIDVHAVWYPALICGAVGLLLLAHDYFRCRERHRRLCGLLNEISTIAERLPIPRSPVEEDYCRLLRALADEMRAANGRLCEERTELSDYYALWVHQIKAPIAVMQVLLQSEDTPEHRELSAELFRIERYVEMALSFVRLGDSDTDLVIREYPLDSIIRGSVRKFAPQFIHKRLKLEYDGTDVSAVTDEKWLQLILEQLLSNSIKYTGVGGTVRISVTNQREIILSDTGIGIVPEDIPRIFEKGFTGYNGHQNRKSTGLGLYLSKSAADRIGCGLSVESQAGKGSVFTISLPAENEC